MRRAAFLLVALLALGAASPERPRVVLALTPISRLDLPWWRARFVAKDKELHAGRVDLVFYGDSITADYERAGPPAWQDFRPVWQHYYGSRHAVNLGFKGDTTANLLWRIEHGEAAGIAPRVAVVLIGANNLGRLHWSAEDTLAGIDADIAALHARLPHTAILLLGILPSERSVFATRTTAMVNQALAAHYAHVPSVTFLDIGRVFVKEGKLDRTLFLDPLLTPPEAPLHPTAEGQARMAAAIEPTLSALLNTR